LSFRRKLFGGMEKVYLKMTRMSRKPYSPASPASYGDNINNGGRRGVGNTLCCSGFAIPNFGVCGFIIRL
jgi:hypothetical protein